VEERVLGLIDIVIEETQAKKLQKEIKNKVHNKMEQVNKEYFLKEQLKQIQKELGTENMRDEEIEQYEQKLNALKPYMSENAYKEVQKQIKRLSRMHQDSGDANILQNYIEWVLEIPFDKYARQKLSIQKVAKQLDADHYSLQKPKERIVEYFAVKELVAKREADSQKNDKNTKIQNNSAKQEKGTILCFYGPPGVGKTSLANSIAKAIKRQLVRIALGGLEDVNELRGHRRTYIGAMPGRITQGLIEAKEMNPVIVLDEIDKVGRSYRGDPTSVLLEILDPEQNHAFRDYYTNFDIDLSQVIFIATANDISTIPAPLRDRMEFISISSYTPQEKCEIAKKYLIPQELQKHGLSQNELKITTPALKNIIESYTREAGVRSLRHKLDKIMRKSATMILKGEKSVTITPHNVGDFLDKIVFEISPADKKNIVGVVNGLAWTSVGGDVLK
ncbi:MAG: AAA family ATPase, partial [Helicobacter japonicus]|nr:AAA family ATPase [Helicobacter japonicus]